MLVQLMMRYVLNLRHNIAITFVASRNLFLSIFTSFIYYVDVIKFHAKMIRFYIVDFSFFLDSRTAQQRTAQRFFVNCEIHIREFPNLQTQLCLSH